MSITHIGGRCVNTTTFSNGRSTVNAKGFDLRLRLPPGWDEIEAQAKKRAGELLVRGGDDLLDDVFVGDRVALLDLAAQVDVIENVVRLL